jgi:hypothetical protein
MEDKSGSDNSYASLVGDPARDVAVCLKKKNLLRPEAQVKSVVREGSGGITVRGANGVEAVFGPDILANNKVTIRGSDAKPAHEAAEACFKDGIPKVKLTAPKP